VPLSSFFGGVQRFAGQALGRAQRAYGQVDKSVFGGALPGGADSPLIGKSRPYFERPRPSFGPQGATSAMGAASALGSSRSPSGDFRSQFEKDLGDVTNRVATAVAGAQPFVKSTVESAPAPVRSLLSGGLNALPISANLFARYYTGLGSEGLQLPSSFTSSIRSAIQNPSAYSDRTLPGLQAQEHSLVDLLGRFKPEEKTGPQYRYFNDALAANRSNQARMRAGDIPITTANRTTTGNPLTALGTSIGDAWFTPQPGGGWKSKETYDFVYGGADQRVPLGPYLPSQFKPDSPSANFASAAGSAFAQQLEDLFSKKKEQVEPLGTPVKPGAGPQGGTPYRIAPASSDASSGLALLGRAIVSKMRPSPFTYDINVPPAR